MLRRRSALAALALLFFALVGLRSFRTPAGIASDSLPPRLSDDAFWRLVSDFSEPNGYFRSDNFLSNERAFQRVIPRLTATLPKGGVYLGVGPEQNFTYIAALRPKLAFIVDIRRGNLIEHLLYKAFVELSATRVEFLTRLFARTPASDLPVGAGIDEIFAAFEGAAPSQDLFDRNLQEARDHLERRHNFALSADDLQNLEYVYAAFYQGGPELNYTFLNGGFGRSGFFPTYADLMTESDGRGEQRSYLATEENFRFLRELERNNAIVPLVGNFAGPKALRSVGRYLRGHNATVTAFYTSNVEMYLFQQSDDWMKFYGNVATLPVTGQSTFIRSISNRGFRSPAPTGVPGARASTLLSRIDDLVTAYRTGRIGRYSDVVAMSK